MVVEKEGGQGQTLDVCPSYTGPSQKKFIDWRSDADQGMTRRP